MKGKESAIWRLKSVEKTKEKIQRRTKKLRKLQRHSSRTGLYRLRKSDKNSKASWSISESFTTLSTASSGQKILSLTHFSTKRNRNFNWWSRENHKSANIRKDCSWSVKRQESRGGWTHQMELALLFWKTEQRKPVPPVSLDGISWNS